MPVATMDFSQGVVTSRARGRLSQGELRAATGGYYKDGDTERLWKLPGRSLFGASGAGAARISGLALCAFDEGTDRLVALSGGTLFSATPGETGVFASLQAGLNPLATALSAAHMDDRWYLANGYDKNRVLEADGTVRLHGLEAPQLALSSTTAAGAASVQRATAEDNPGPGVSSPFVNPIFARDVLGSLTFATGTRKTAGVTSCVWKLFTADTSANRFLKVDWRLTGLQSPLLDSPGRIGSEGGTSDAGFKVDVTIAYSVDGGSSYTTLVQRLGMTSAMASHQVDSVAITANSNLVRVLVTLVYHSGTSPATLQVYDIRTQSGSTSGNFSTSSGGLYYAVTEYDEQRGLESPAGPILGPINFTASNQVILTLPSASVNPTVTKWRIYRTFDGGIVPSDLGLIEAVPIGETVYRDTFERFDKDTPAVPLYRLKSITVENGTLRFPLDTPPPSLSHLATFQGALFGLRRDKPRSAVYSEPGAAESWPECNVIESFPMPEHDTLVGSVTIGEVGHLIGAEGTMFLLTSLPRAILGTFSPESKVVPLKGQPGLVSQDAIVAFSVEGEPRAAWVSPFGIHETSGVESRLLTSEQDWDGEVATLNLSTAVLRWDPKRRLLIFCYPSGNAGNDRVWLLHMSPEHRKPSGLPKITKPHYGKIACLASGQVGGEYLIWSGHTGNGNVYTEFSGSGTDESGAYSGTVSPLLVTTTREYGPYRQFGVYKANLRHSDFGAGEAVALTASLGRDSSGSVLSVAKTLGLSGEKGEEFLVARSGEWIELSLVHLGTGIGALEDVRMETLAMGMAGQTVSSP